MYKFRRHTQKRKITDYMNSDMIKNHEKLYQSEENYSFRKPSITVLNGRIYHQPNNKQLRMPSNEQF